MPRLWLGRALCETVIHPALLRPACSKPDVFWELAPPQGTLQNTVYTDGSALHADVPSACRAGWGLAMMTDDGVIAGRACGPLPLTIQSSGAAEIYAAAMAILHAAPPLMVVTDYEQLVVGWKLGLGAYATAGSKNGEAWRIFWRIADDFGLDHIRIRKVPAHKPLSAVDEGLISYDDWVGNRAADEMARQGARLHPSNEQAVQKERDRTQTQFLMGQYIGWLNAQLRINDAYLVWQSEVLTDIRPDRQTLKHGAVQEGGVSDAASGYEGLQKGGLSRDLHAVDADPLCGASREVVEAGLKAEAPPGCVHPSYLAMATRHYVFCRLCGTYGKQLRRSKLHLQCPKTPRNRTALVAIRRLMQGIEPRGAGWQKLSEAAEPLVED